jgi:hypothetical protein
MSIVTIKEVKGMVTCADDGTAEHVFNVKNATDKALKVGMQLSIAEPVGEAWLKIDGSTEHDLDVETMTQVSVKVQVPSDCAAGKYGYRLRVFDPDRPGEIYTDGDTVFFEVPEKKEDVIEKKENGKKPFKWWIPAAIAAAVIVVGVIVYLLLPAGVNLPDFTKEDWNQAKAEAFLKKNQLTYTLELQQDPKPGSEKEILGQVPGPDTKVKKDEKVILKIAATRVPSVKGLGITSAMQRISSAGLFFTDKDLRIQTVSQSNQHEKVLNQDPQPGKLVAKKTAVKLTVGRLVNKRFDFKNLPQMKAMPGIKMSPNFLKREVEPAPE